MQFVARLLAQTLTPAIATPTLIALVFASVLGVMVVNRLEQARDESIRSAFALETGEITLRIEERLRTYREVLKGAHALFQASEAVSRDEWRRYVTALNLQVEYPGIQGVGFAVHIPADHLARHERTVRAEGFPDYRVSPPGPRSEYSAIVYLEPFDWRNQRAFGYDMLSEPVRRQAMTQALHSGLPTLSGKVRLVQETTIDPQAGVLLYLPLFRRGADLGSPARREQALLGWVYGPFRMNDLVAGALSEAGPRIRLRIHDGHDTTPGTLLFDSHPDWDDNPDHSDRRLLELDGRIWTLVFDDTPRRGARQTAHGLETGAVVLICGLLVLLTAAAAAARSRARALDRASTSLRNSEARYSTLVNLSRDGIAALDAQLNFSFINPRLVRLLGYPEESLIGTPFSRLWPPGEAAVSKHLLTRLQRGEPSSYEQDLLTADGRTLTAIVTDAPHLDKDGSLQGVILSITDISERKASEERIRYLATHDSLTGLSNRASFLEQMNASLLMARRQHSRFALLYLDLDHFKEINDNLGHAAGDALLMETAQRLRRCLRASDLLARQGGDEFMALLHDMVGMNEALAVAEKIRRAVGAPILLEGREARVSVSIGIALYPDHGTDLDSLSRHADAAMYRDKSNRRNGASAAVIRRTGQ